MSFFARYFAALDGPDPLSSLDLVADDVEFVIFWASDDGRRSARQLTGGVAELRAMIEAGGDMSGWAHHILTSAVVGGVEFAQGETRTDAGERIGTFLCSAQLDADGRMTRYLVARSPAIAFSP
jgi:hypothetical protein